MVVVLLPVFNEEKSLPVPLPKRVLTALGAGYRIVVRNDGSRDQTAAILDEYRRRLPLEVITQKINRGLGETMRDLFERAVNMTGPDDAIVRLDCDDTHEPEHIVDMLRKLDAGYDVVIASRFEPGGGQSGVSTYRMFASHGANLFRKIFFGIRGVRDFSSGICANRARVMKVAVGFYGNNFIQLKALGLTWTLQKLIKVDILGARFAEMPLQFATTRSRARARW